MPSVPCAFLWLCRADTERKKPLRKLCLFPGRIFSQEEEPGYGVMICSSPRRKRLFVPLRYPDARRAVPNAGCNAAAAGRDCSHVPGAHQPPGHLCRHLGLEGAWSTRGRGEGSAHRPGLGAFGSPVPRGSPGPGEEEQPQRFCQPHASSICSWGTFVPDLSPVSWSYYKQVQSASPLLFR